MVAMRNALIKDTYREIRRTISRFLSIFSIVAIGVSFFAGIRATCPDMKITADRYFDEYNLMDMRLVSTIGFNDEDIEKIKGMNGVEGVLPAYSMDALVNIEDRDLVLKVLALPKNMTINDRNYINKSKLVEGRYPKSSNECVAEKGKIINSGLSIGSKIKLSSGTDKSIDESLKVSEFTIVGIVETPYYISFERGTSSIGSGKINSFIMVPEEDFKIPAYTDVFITVKNAKNYMSYSNDYQDLIEPVKKQYESLGKERAQTRYDEIIREATKKLEDSKKELADAERKQSDELKRAENRINSSQIKISQEEKKLNVEEQKFKKTSADAKEQIKEGYIRLEEGEKQYADQLRAFDNMKEALDPSLPGAGEQLAETQVKLSAFRKTLDETRASLDMQGKKLEASEKTAQEGFVEAHRKLNKARKDLIKAEEDYKKGKEESDKKINDSRQKIKDAEEDIRAMEKPQWYVLDRNTNPGFVDYGNAADRMDAIARVFPVFFFLVAALVCLTTMTRMVDEQRVTIGTLKALGYGKLSIASKYLLYAASASIGGSIFGLIVGFRVFPTVIFNAYGIMYTLPPVVTEFNITYAAISTAFAVLVTTLSAWMACYRELMEEPAYLMRPKSPSAGKRIFLERIGPIWSNFNFIQKITARNIFRYKKRLFMTILGIGGCTALLLSGFGLKDSIMSIVTKQFEELYRYDMVIGLKDGITVGEKPDFMSAIYGSRVSDYMLMNELNIDVGKGNIEKSVSVVIPESTERIKDFIMLRTRKDGMGVPLKKDGVVLTEKLALKLGAHIGDEVYIKKGDSKKVMVKVTGITENYVSHYVYMPPELYERLYKEKPSFLQILAKTTDNSKDFEDKLSMDIMKNPNVRSVSFTTGISSNFEDIISSLNYVILVLIISAGALAFVVLYNLTNINITERLREIATIKVLGFYDKEVLAYVYRENIFLTIIGAILGLISGIFLHRFIVVTAEVDYVMFGRTIRALSYLFSFILTFMFSGMVNFVMYFKLKKISMVESLKSVD